jgi:O-antigen ligase
MVKWFERLTWIFWLALVASLPFTSLPLVAKLIHTSSVAPAALIFLGLLCVTWLPVYLWKKGTFPAHTKIVLAFFLAGLFSTAVSFFLETPVFKDEGLLSNVISGLVTLCIGVLFYLIATVLPHDDRKVRQTLQVINWSGAVMLAWDILCSVITLLSPGDTPGYLRTIQHLFTTTTFFGNRSVGFTAEPSWLAHILNMVYLPYWFGATISNFTAARKKVWKISFENVLLVVGFGVLFMTLSRAGLAAFILALGFFFIQLNVWVVKKISQKLGTKTARSLVTAGLVLGLLMIYVGGATGVVYVLSKIDPRMEQVFSIDILTESGITKYADTLQFGERFTYWQAGWRTFNQHPLIGVGIGNAGFYFNQNLPDNAWNLSEVRRLVYHTSGLMNVKSMWSRILAETGILGFTFFLLLLAVTGITAFRLTQSKDRMQVSVGRMGICMLMAFIIEGFSVDSFALPYLWFTLGLVAAVWRWTNQSKQGDTNGSF